MKQPDVGNRILQARKEFGLTQEDLAYKCNINVRSLQRIEKGKVQPRSSTLNSLNKNLDLNLMEEKAEQSKSWLTLLHLTSFIPVVIFALIIWVIKKEDIPEMDQHGKDVINFQISMSIYLFASAFLMIFIIGFVTLVIIGWYAAFISIFNSIMVATDKQYKYPLTIKFLT